MAAAAAAHSAASLTGVPSASALLHSFEWHPPPSLAPCPIVIDAAMVKGVRALDGRTIRDVLGASGWGGVEEALLAYRGSSLPFDALLALLAHVAGTPVTDVYEQLSLAHLERAARIHGIALSAEQKEQARLQKEEAKQARHIASELRAFTNSLLRAVEVGGGDARIAALSYGAAAWAGRVPPPPL